MVGDPNGVTTGADGKYTFYLDPATAADGIYSLTATKNGYVFASQLIAPKLGPHDAGLGGAIVNISSDATTSSTMDTTYYTSFQMVFDALNINNTSNGIAQNHIPMDPSDDAIMSEIEDDLREILKDDLAATMTQQSRQMSGFASGASDRLKSRDQNTCSADIAAILQANQVHFATASAVILPESAETLDAIAEVLATCPDARFEVAGHTDDRSSDAYNLGLSSARAAAVVAELKIRGVAMSQLASKGYGESRPIADNATDEGRMLNRRVEFVPLDAVAEADPCGNSVVVNRDLDANSADGGQTIAGRFTREYRDCEIDGWRIFSGSAGYLSNDQGIAQGMLSLNYRVERFVDQDTVSGWFTGLYSSNDQISDLATGSINGFGLNGGVYGATRLQDNVIADYYLGLAAGIHNFDLDFDRTNGAVNAKGFYTYSALFAGSAISGELSLGKTVLSPRLGFDAAWSPGGEADITASRAGIEETGSLSTGEVSGLRLYGELQFVDLMVDQPEVLSFTPRIFCDRPIGEAGNVCGYGGKLEFSSPTDASGRQSSLIWDAEGSESHEYYSLTLNIGRQIFGGSLDTSATVSQDGDVSAKIGFSSKF